MMRMNDQFHIYIDRLKDQHTEVLNLSLTPDFLDVDEPELRFRKPVAVRGKAYLALQELVLDLEVAATAEMPCAICNEPTETPINLDRLMLVEPISEVQSGIFDMRSLVREAILLELPLKVECPGGCPKRLEVEKFFKQPSSDTLDGGNFYPFKELSAEDYER